jgi:hypothetical protein
MNVSTVVGTTLNPTTLGMNTIVPGFVRTVWRSDHGSNF